MINRLGEVGPEEEHFATAMKVAEIYQSIQGEGLLTGTESVFLRVSGCNLRCVFCDTPYASWEPVGTDRSATAIADDILEFQVQHVVLTGGEPMLFAELIPICEKLKAVGRHITIETAGTLYLPVECDLMSISPKLGNSVPPVAQFPHWHQRHERDRHAPQVVQRLTDEYSYQVKFVVGTERDVQEVLTYLKDFPELERNRIMLMPEATTPEALRKVEAWLPAVCDQNDLRYCPRKQIDWFGCVPGT